MDMARVIPEKRLVNACLSTLMTTFDKGDYEFLPISYWGLYIPHKPPFKRGRFGLQAND